MKRKIYKLLSSVKQGLFALALTVFSGTAFSQITYTFNYTGNVQTINLPAGSYSITCWGADGGNATDGITPTVGGKGGYSTGLYTNPTTGIHNIYVGAHGGNASGASNLGGGGGGMSDVTTAANPNIIIIAAGGGGGATSGGASEFSDGGYGGGLVGGPALDGSGVSTGTAATGGSQTAGGFAGAGSYGAGSPSGYGFGGGGSNGGTILPSAAGVMHGPGGAGGFGGNGGWNGGGGGCTSSGGNDHSGGGGGGYYGGGGGRGDGGAGGGGSGYVGGLTSGVTTGTGQPGFVINPDVIGNGLVLITELCNITLNASTNPICLGASVTLTTSASNVNWSTGATGISTINVTPSVTTTYTLFGVGSNGTATCSTGGAITVTVNPVPSISAVVIPTIVCVGGSSTITPSGGALVYSMGTGTASQFVVTPSANTVATISGTNVFGCVSTQTFAVKVNANQLSISSSTTTVCMGGTVNLIANGVNSYTWSTGSHFQSIPVAPTTATTYTASGYDVLYCLLSNVVTINTNPKPNVTAASDKITVCKGESINLTAGGASTYTWNSGATGSVTTANLPVDIIYVYSVIGVDANGCSDTAVVSVTASRCTGINEVTSNLGIKVYPNPTKGEFMIESANNDVKNIEVTDVTGKVVLSQTLQANVAINMTPFASGIYYVKVQSAEGVEVIKVVKE